MNPVDQVTAERIAAALERIAAHLEAQQAARPKELEPPGGFLKARPRA